MKKIVIALTSVLILIVSLGHISAYAAPVDLLRGYNEHDVKALLSFKKQAGNKTLNWGENTVPLLWHGTKWVKSGDEKRLKSLDITWAEKTQPTRLSGKLDLSGCTELKTLVCDYNFNITSIDVSGCEKLVEFKFSAADKLKTLKLKDCVKLKSLWVESSALTALDLPESPVLEDLRLWTPNLASLDISKYKKLKTLTVGGKFNTLDVTHLPLLEELYCSGLGLKRLDVTKCPELKYLECSYNDITSLDVTKCLKLESLSCGSNRLTSLDVSRCTKLVHLNCSDNKIEKLDVSKCTNLGSLYCSNNRLRSLDVTKCTNLWLLNATGNNMTSKDVKGTNQTMSGEW